MTGSSPQALCWVRTPPIAMPWQRAMERGEVGSPIDAGTATELLFGPQIVRLVPGHLPLNAGERRRSWRLRLAGC